MNPLLSVIIPIHNSEKYLRECIDSVIAQTFKDFELILVDDASTDSSREICDEYSKKYDFIKVIYKEHGGPTHTRKAGLNLAVGEYISFIDSDDYIKPQMYDYLLDKLIKYNADIAICNITIEKENSRTPLNTNFEEGLYDKKRLENTVYNHMLFDKGNNLPGVHPSLCNKIIRRSILEKVMKNITDNIYFGEDGICSYPCMLEADNIYIAKNKHFYIYRQNETSVSRKYDKTVLNKLPLLISVFDEEFGKRNFDGSVQINSYAAIYLVYNIRNDLLYNTSQTLREKIKELKKYLTLPRFQSVFETAESTIDDRQLKLKCFLLKKRYIYTLYVLFYVKDKIMLLKGSKNEK